jgi:uncharacterized SAM-dependent methyltransferase
VSLLDQDVRINELGKTFHFKRYELIWTELSKKYSLEELKQLGEISGLDFKQHFTDSQHHFTDTLFYKA